MSCYLLNLFNLKSLEQVYGIGIGNFGGFLSGLHAYVELFDLLLCHRGPIPGDLLLVEIEVDLEVTVEVVVKIADLRLDNRFKLFVAETAAAIYVLFGLFLGLCVTRPITQAQLLELVPDVVAAQLDHRLVLPLQLLPKHRLNEHLSILQCPVHESFDLLAKERV